MPCVRKNGFFFHNTVRYVVLLCAVVSCCNAVMNELLGFSGKHVF